MTKDHSGQRSNGDDDRLDNFSTDSSSVATSEEEEHRLKERRRKKKKKSHRDDKDDDDDDDNDNDDDQRRRRRHNSKSDKKKKKHRKSSSSSREKKKKDRKRRTDEYSSDDDDDDDESSDYSRRRKHSKKDRKRRRKEHKKDDYKSKKGGSSHDRDRHNRTTMVQSSSSNNNTRGQQLARALHNLLNDKPNFASELPLILIRLAGGTTFDLRAVTDSSIAQGLQTVFESLEIFGVKKQESSGMWMFQNPPGASRRDELVLLKVIRSILNEEGLTMDEVTKYDKIRQQELSQENAQQQAATHDDECLKPDERRAMKEFTIKILEKFLSKDSTLGSQLANLCKTIVEGESISIDGIPDEELKAALGSLFSACGLEKSEIEDDDDDDDDESDDDESDGSPLMGYGLPDSGETNDAVQLKLAIIMSACREGPPKRKAVGPMRRPMTEKEEQDAKALYSANKANEDKEDEDDDEGPLLPGSVAARKDKSPNVPMEVIKAQAKHRELQLKCTAAGIEMPIEGGGREEWMLIPGEHDFLSGIKSGQAVKSRGFQNKKARGGEKAAAPVHPAVQAEMDAIMQAHQDARGPSLMDEHRSKLSIEKKQKLAAANGKNEWKWSRDDDLDSGRRVDKDHLGMILGGAADNLKTKFKGGFS